MNQQPQEYVGNLFAFIFICLFAYHAIKSYINGNAINLKELDLITLGYVQESDGNKTNTVESKSNKIKLESQQLYIDCVEALYSLGMKKSEAKKRTKDIFTNTDPQPANVQQFIILALRTQS